MLYALVKNQPKKAAKSGGSTSALKEWRGVIRSVPMKDCDLKKICDETFLKGFNSYLDPDDPEKFKPAVSFAEDWLADGEELFVIKDYEDVHGLSKFTDSSITPLSDDELNQVACFFVRNSGCILVQAFDRRSLLTPEQHCLLFKIFGSSDTAYEVNEHFRGFFLSENVHAVIKGGALYFQSFYTDDKALGLQKYLTEASDEELKGFFEHPSIKFEGGRDEIAELTQSPSTFLRKDIGWILKSGVLDKYSPQYLVKRARSVKKIEIPLRLDDGKLLIPKGKSALNEALKFLRNTIFKSILDDEYYRANSRRRLVAKAQA